MPLEVHPTRNLCPVLNTAVGCGPGARRGLRDYEITRFLLLEYEMKEAD